VDGDLCNTVYNGKLIINEQDIELSMVKFSFTIKSRD